MMNEQLALEVSPTNNHLPVVAAVTTGLVVLANIYSESTAVRAISEVRPDSSTHQWLTNWPGSFFIASPDTNPVADTLLSAGSVAATFGLFEHKHGSKELLKWAPASQLLACVATRAAAVWGLVKEEDMHEPDVGSSGVTFFLGSYLATERLLEQRSKRDTIIWGSLLSAAALGVIVDGYKNRKATNIIAHSVSLVDGAAAAYIKHRQKSRKRT